MRPHRWQPTRLPRPWDSPGKNTGVGCHFLLQCMKVKCESEVAQSCPTLSNPMDCSLPGSSVHGIFQARVLEWGVIAFSSSSLTRDQTQGLSSGHRTGKKSICIPIPNKGNAKECSNYRTIALISHTSNEMLAQSNAQNSPSQASAICEP